MRNFVLALAAVALLTSPALAGGGTKGNSTISVQNCTDGDEIAVIVLAKDADIPSNEEEFFDAGGKILEEGDIATFKSLKAGDYVVWAAFVDSGDEFDGETIRPVRLKKNQTREFCAELFDGDLAITPK